MLAHSILYAKSNKNIDAVYVSTDNAEIKKVALKYGAKVIDRPKELSGDLEPTVTALKHVLKTIDDAAIDYVILLQPTNPLRPKNMLEDAFKIFIRNKYDSLFTVSQNHHKFGKIKNDKYVPFNYEIGQRSQDLEPLYYENGLLYITKAELIMQNTIMSATAYPLVIEHPFARIDIDTLADFEFAEYIYTKY